jgi:hypothetical protein
LAIPPLNDVLRWHRAHPIVSWYALALVLFGLLEAVPGSGLPDRGQVVLEAARVVLGLLLLLYYLGWSLSDLLLPQEWKSYAPLLTPLIGLVALVPLCYFLNYVFGIKEATLVIVVAVFPLAARRFKRGSPTGPWNSSLAVPAVGAVLLLCVALLPHLIQGSLGLLSQNFDEEAYFYLAKYLLNYPTGASAPGPALPIAGLLYSGGTSMQGSVIPTAGFFTSTYRAEGFGSQYLIAVASAVSNVDTFDAYQPTTYVVLALGVIGWHLLFKEVLHLQGRAAGIATAMFTICGLPLWLASYGYDRQICWITLTPFAVSALVLALRSGRGSPLALCALTVGAALSIEARVVAVQLAFTAAGLGVYWLVFDRSLATLGRIAIVAVGAITFAAPLVWYFVQGMVASGAGVHVLGDSELLATWGPGFGDFPPVEVGLGLEPNVFAKISEPINGLSWLDPLNIAMSASAPFLAYIVIAAAVIGGASIARRSPVLLAIVGSLLAWLLAMRLLLPFPYGYFKLFGILGPLTLGLAVVGVSWLLGRRAAFGPAARRAAKLVVVFCCVLVALFLMRNTSYGFLFGARGWGLSIPPSLVNSIAAFATATAPESRVLVTNSEYYPVPANWILLRKDHRGAIGSLEEASVVWGTRIHSLVASSLIGRETYGLFRTEWFDLQRLLPDGSYDYYVLMSDEDPRLRGLDDSDRLVAAEGVSLYRTPHTGRASSGQILSARGTLSIDDKTPLVVQLEPGGFKFEPQSGTQDASQSTATDARVSVGLMALTDTTVDVTIGDHSTSLLLDPGVTWYTTPTVSLPSTLRVESTGWSPAKVVSLRMLPPGDEGLDRSNDVILLNETVADRDGVKVGLWLSNPAQDLAGTLDPRANLVIPGSPPIERTLALRIPARGESWVLHLSSDGNVQQLLNGVEPVPIAPLPWLHNGGLLSIWFRLGHLKPVKVPVAIAENGDQQLTLLTYADPAQIRLGVLGSSPNGAASSPGLAAMEGTRVRSERGFEYLIEGGRRHWIPDSMASGAQDEARTLPPEQLWLIPPGLPAKR